MAPTLVYDGDCGICTASVGFLRRSGCTAELVTSREWTVSHPGDAGLAAGSVVLVEADGTRRVEEAAVAGALRRSSAPWPTLGSIIDAPVLRVLARGVYRFVARHRTRISSMLGMRACALPDPRR
jgi:predicted DCC family thiol-disulfide oxidoreductase YuxK